MVDIMWALNCNTDMYFATGFGEIQEKPGKYLESKTVNHKKSWEIWAISGIN